MNYLNGSKTPSNACIDCVYSEMVGYHKTKCHNSKSKYFGKEIIEDNLTDGPCGCYKFQPPIENCNGGEWGKFETV